MEVGFKLVGFLGNIKFSPSCIYLVLTEPQN